MTRDQKEKYVIQLYTEGKSFKKIAKLTHMSFRDISAIIKRHQENIERENGQLEEKDDIKSKSKTTQAIKMFSEGKNLVEVVIALNLPPDEILAIHREFLELNNMHKLVEVYAKIEDYLPSFLELFRIFHSRGLGRNEVLEILKVICTGELPYMQEKADYLQGRVNWLENEVRRNEHNLSVINQRVKELTYRENGIIPMTKTKELTNRVNNKYPPLPDDTSIIPVY